MDKLLNTLKDRQVKPKPLYCTGNTNCWCSNITYNFPITPGYDICMTPAQMILEYKDRLPEIDYKYLLTILGRECIW